MPFLNKYHNEIIECGLVHLLEHLSISVPVPLKSVAVKCKILDFVAKIEVIQEYVNFESRPIEAKYLFPVEEEAALIDFEAELEGRTVKIEIKEKEDARRIYQNSIAEQKTAFKLERIKVDMFEISVGYLNPGAGAKIKLTYLSELPAEEQNVRLTIPTTIAPRYIPPDDDSEAAKKIAEIKYQWESPAPLNIEITSVMKDKIKRIKSPSHSIINSDGGLQNGKYVMKTTLKGGIGDMDRDFILLLSTFQGGANNPAAFLETDPKKGTTCGMVSLVPSFNLKVPSMELIFLVDRSGSMRRNGIHQAKLALNLFLHSLPNSCLFNIYSFGSRFDSLFKESVEYNDETLKVAKKHVANMSADYGGTELFYPIQHIFDSQPKSRYPRQVFVLTDGKVSNDDQVIGLVKRNAHMGRVFSLGLGLNCSRHLVKGIARAGMGLAIFADIYEDLRPKVMSHLRNALQPAIDSINVEWIGIVDNSNVVETRQPELKLKSPLHKEEMFGQAPLHIPPIFNGHRLLIYHFFKTKEYPTSVKITASTSNGPLSMELKLDQACQIEGSFIHQLAARKKIQELEESHNLDESDVKRVVTELSLSHNLASKYTSYIGVDAKGSEKYYQAMVTRIVPHQISSPYANVSVLFKQIISI